MSMFSKATNKHVVHLVALAGLVVAVAVSAYAVSSKQVLRKLTLRSITGPCCALIGETVQVTEGRNVSPVVVTFSADYNSTGPYFVGLSVNLQSCNFYGARELPASSNFANATYQWVIFPSDGLGVGTNTFSLCAGARNNSTDTLNLGFNTLAARVGN